jgi:hypothetical protein
VKWVGKKPCTFRAMKLAIVILANIVILSGAGITCLFFSREIQRYAVNNSRRLRLNLGFVDSDRFVVHLKTCGVVALIMVLLTVYVSVRNL